MEVEFASCGLVALSEHIIEHTLQGVGVSRLYLSAVMHNIRLSYNMNTLNPDQFAQLIAQALATIYPEQAETMTKHFIALIM